MESPTIYDVADAAGVSPSTVSRVLNYPNQVSKPTRKQVQSVIEELEFEPNPSAQEMGRGSPENRSVVSNK
ncbi:MAG: LacI family DNA-binding transcriptional regulator [Salinibacter sp.]